MTLRLSKNILLVLLLLVGSAGGAQQIRLDQVLFGIEYSFQDQEMVNEPGRNTMRTPHKEQKAQGVVNQLVLNLGLGPEAISPKSGFKQGHFLNVPGDGEWVVNPEPVTIEVNTAPRHFDDIESTAETVFRATAANGLVPYVNPAAERSGMGHIHVGARRMGENPFFLHPLLLRNVMVYLHKHPSLLYGFAEAYDVGLNSNIETYHDGRRQREFQAAVKEFDAWYDQAAPEEKLREGLNMFLLCLRKNDRVSEFFQHYRFMNLEHLKGRSFLETDTGKLTVEFRNFRPPKNPRTAEAFASLLIAIMEKQSQPGHREEFQWIAGTQALRFYTGSKVESDWTEVRADLKIKNFSLDAAVHEYVEAIHERRSVLPRIRGAELFPAYSPKQQKGRLFELRLPVTEFPETPSVQVGEQFLEFEKVSLGRQNFWVALIDNSALRVPPPDLLDGTAISLRAVLRCEHVLAN